MEVKDINVLQLDTEALNIEIDKYVKMGTFVSEEDKKLYNYRLKEHKLCLATSKKGTLGVFDDDLAGAIIKDGKMPIAVSRTRQDGEFHLDMFPVLELTLSMEALNELWNKPINAEEFMGTRFNYNSRLKVNQATFVKFIAKE